MKMEKFSEKPHENGKFFDKTPLLLEKIP